MSISYRKEDNVTGELQKAALSLKEILDPEERQLSMFLFGFSSPLGNIDAFKDSDVDLIKNSHGLAVYWFSESVDVDYFHELSPIQKYFVQGVEDQLARRVLYAGGIVGDEFVWHPVPREIPGRWLTETTEAQRNQRHDEVQKTTTGTSGPRDSDGYIKGESTPSEATKENE